MRVFEGFSPLRVVQYYHLLYIFVNFPQIRRLNVRSYESPAKLGDTQNVLTTSCTDGSRDIKQTLFDLDFAELMSSVNSCSS